MAITTPKGEQIQFVSSKTGTHNLDTYLEAAELGNRQLHDLLDDMFDATTGVFKADNFQFRYDNNSTDKKLQIRVGQFASGNSGWTDITSFFNVRGTFSTSDAYNNFDLVLDSNKDLYLVHGLLTQNNTFSSESNFISNANTTKIVDVSLAQDWAKKTNGLVDGTGYSSKAWAVGGTGVTTTASGGASKEWATTTGGAVDTSEYSSKEYAVGTTVPTGSAKEWATDTSGAVASSEYSAKEYAQGTQSGTGGSAKDWAQKTGSTVDGSNYSAKYWATHSNVTTVVSNISDIQALALKTTELGLLGTTTVVGNLGQLGTSTVVGHMANLNATNVISNIGTVAGQISPTNNIATVAGANTNITTLTQSGVISNIGTVAGQISPTNNIQTVAGLSTEIAAVAGISSEIQTVHTNIAKVQTAADDLLETTSEIDTVATSIGNVDAVGTNIGSVNAISPHIGNVNTVATNINNVNSFFDIYSVASSNPTTNLNAGDLVFNTTTSTLNVYDGANWQSTAEAAQRTLTSHTVTSSEQTAGTVTVSAAYTVGLVDVYLNGLHLGTSDFTATNGTSVTIANPTAGDIIDIVALSSFNAANYGLMAARNNVSESDLNIAGSPVNGYYLKADNTAAGGLVWDQVDLSTKLSLSGGTMSGALDMGNNDITTTGKVLFANMYANPASLPNATTYHGMFAHAHSTGKGYFAHNNAWVELANHSQLANSSNWDTAYGWGDHGSAGYLTTSSASSTYLPLGGGTLTGDLSGTNVTLSGYLRGPSTFTIDPATHGDDTGTVIVKGNLQVKGTTTTVDSTTVNIDDNLITLAAGNTGDYFSADASGIEVGMGTHPNWFIKIFAEGAYWHISHSTLISGDLAFEENVGNGGGGSGPQTGGNISFPQGQHQLSWSGVRGAYIKAVTGDASISYTTNRLEFNVGTGEALRLDGNKNATFGGNVLVDAGTIGSAGSSSNEIFIYADAGKGILINNNGLLPGTSTGGGSNNTTDLGQTDVRWKDLYLSGAGYAANNFTAPNFYTGVGSMGLRAYGNDLTLKSQSDDYILYGANNGRVYLYHNGTNTLYTDANGIYVRSVNDAGYGVVYLGNNGSGGVYGNSGNVWLNSPSGHNVIWGQSNSYTYLYYSGSWKFRTTNVGVEVNGSQIMSNNQSIFWGGISSISKISGESNGDLVIQSYDDMYLSSNWVRFFDGSNGHPGSNEYARISRTGNWFTGPIGVGGNNSGTMNTNGGSFGTSGQVLTSQGNATAPTWADPSGSKWEHVTTLTGSDPSTNQVSVYVYHGFNPGDRLRFIFRGLSFMYSDYLCARFSTQNQHNPFSWEYCINTYWKLNQDTSNWSHVHQTGQDYPRLTYDSWFRRNNQQGISGYMDYYQENTTLATGGSTMFDGPRYHGHFFSGPYGKQYYFGGGILTTSDIRHIRFRSYNAYICYGDIVVLKLVN